MSRTDETAALVRELYDVATRLEELHRDTGRRFTLDGHLVGAIGEVLAAERFGLELLPNSTKDHDAKDAEGRLVQIKATQNGRRIAFYGVPERAIVLQLGRDGAATVIYDGPGAAIEPYLSAPGKNGQRTISVAKLRILCK